MHPYIILLLLPLFGLLVFLFLPLPLAALVYIIILIISGVLYWALIRAMKKRPEDGAEGLIGQEVRVVSKLDSHNEARYMVKFRGELWSADSPDDLRPGETVKILSVNGLTLLVEKIGLTKTV